MAICTVCKIEEESYFKNTPRKTYWIIRPTGKEYCGKCFTEIQNKIQIMKRIRRYISREKRYTVLKRQGWKYNYCNISLKWDKNSEFGEEIAHIDHIFPYSKLMEYPTGPENINEETNLQALCPKCNLNKNKREIN